MSKTTKFDLSSINYRSKRKMKPYSGYVEIEDDDVRGIQQSGGKSSKGRLLRNGIYKPYLKTTNGKKRKVRQLLKGSKRMQLKQELIKEN